MAVRGEGHDVGQVIGERKAHGARSSTRRHSAELKDTPDGEIETLAIENPSTYQGMRAGTPNCRSTVRHRRSVCRALRGRARSEKRHAGCDGHAVSAIFAVLERTVSADRGNAHRLESGELLARPERRFEPIAIRSP